MKLTGRFFLSHGGLVLFTLGAGFLLFYGGARLELKHQAEADQKQYLASFSLAAREAVLQREDVAALNFMRLASKNPIIVFTSFFDPTTGSQVVLPLNYAQDPLLTPSALGSENKNFRLSDGTAVSASIQKL